MTNKLITQPTTEPITLAEAKVQLRVTDNVQDALIGTIISAAREHLEHVLQRAVMPQTREVVLDAFPRDADIELRYPKVLAVESVKYLDAVTGLEVTLAAPNYSLDNERDNDSAWLLTAQGVTWPVTLAVANAVRVRYTCGYADAASVPAAIKMWLLLAIEHLFDRCQAGGSMTVPENFAAGIIDRYRVWGL